MAQQEEFFNKSENLKLLRNFIKKIEAIDPTKNELNIVLQDLISITQSIINNAQFYDESSPTNINWIGNSFLSEIKQFIQQNNNPAEAFNTEEERIRSLFTSAYRFLCEADFRSPNGLVHELKRIKDHVDQQLNFFIDSDKQQLIYANYIMPADIVKQLINHPNMIDIKSYNEKYDSAITLKKDWDDEISKKEIAINELKDKLEEYKIGFNFVALFKGFDELSKNKNTEATWALWFMITLALLAIAPVGIELYFFLFKTQLLKDNLSIMIYAIFPTLTIQLVLIYFFRVALLNYKSIKAQLLQLELRKTLCQFIQSYSVYAKEMKASDKSSLEKFENLIFSGIIANEENLPSTFDGLEQISKIVQSLKK